MIRKIVKLPNQYVFMKKEIKFFLRFKQYFTLTGGAVHLKIFNFTKFFSSKKYRGVFPQIKASKFVNFLASYRKSRSASIYPD